MMNTEIANTLETFKAHLTKQAAIAGVDISGLTVEYCTLDHTWGAHVGLFFSGAHAERAARCFQKWAKRLPRSYDAQTSVGEIEPMTRSVYRANGVVNHTRGEFKAPDYYPAEQHADYIAGFELTAGVAVGYVYFPCAE